MPSAIHPTQLESAFSDFLSARSLSLTAIGLPTLLGALTEFYETVALQSCLQPDEDWLHCEIVRGTIYFERLLDVPCELMDDDDMNAGERVLWSLFVQPDLTADETTDALNINLSSDEAANMASFVQSIHSQPLMQWADTLGPVRVTASLEPVG